MGDNEVFVPISSTKTSRSVATRSATITLQVALKNSSRSSAPTVLFSREAKPLHQPPYGGVAEGRAGYVLQKAAPLSDGGGRAFLYIPFEEELAFLAYLLVGSSGALSGLKRPSFSSDPRVALDRGEAHVEEAGRLSFWHAPLYGANYLLAEIFRVGSHPIMIACGSIFVLTAVRDAMMPSRAARRSTHAGELPRIPLLETVWKLL